MLTLFQGFSQFTENRVGGGEGEGRGWVSLVASLGIG